MREALRAEEPGTALEMLLPILDFFNQYQDSLDDSYSAGSMFVQEWGSCLDEAIQLLPEDWNDGALVQELLATMEQCQDYGDDLSEGMDPLRAIIEELVSTAEDSSNVSSDGERPSQRPRHT